MKNFILSVAALVALASSAFSAPVSPAVVFEDCDNIAIPAPSLTPTCPAGQHIPFVAMLVCRGHYDAYMEQIWLPDRVRACEEGVEAATALYHYENWQDNILIRQHQLAQARENCSMMDPSACAFATHLEDVLIPSAEAMAQHFLDEVNAHNALRNQYMATAATTKALAEAQYVSCMQSHCTGDNMPKVDPMITADDTMPVTASSAMIGMTLYEN